MTISITLPDWLPEFLRAEGASGARPAVADRVAFVLRLCGRNIEEKSGGPFAAAVFERDSGVLVAAAVNRVIPCHTSIAHAETLALALAQQKLGCHDLAASHLPAMELVTSAQPCNQCFGNTWWSGVQSLVMSARAEDVEEILGFREGPLPADWQQLLENRPAPLPDISVQRDVLREEGRQLLASYLAGDGAIYNAGSAK